MYSTLSLENSLVGTCGFNLQWVKGEVYCALSLENSLVGTCGFNLQ